METLITLVWIITYCIHVLKYHTVPCKYEWLLCAHQKIFLRPGLVVHAYIPSYSRGTGRKIIAQSPPGQMHETLYEKQTEKKRTRDVVQVVERMLSKCKALNSIPSSTGKNKKNQNLLSSFQCQARWSA
jgi:hypothetical protein